MARSGLRAWGPGQGRQLRRVAAATARMEVPDPGPAVAAEARRPPHEEAEAKDDLSRMAGCHAQSLKWDTWTGLGSISAQAASSMFALVLVQHQSGAAPLSGPMQPLQQFGPVDGSAGGSHLPETAYCVLAQ